jgi:hypothetical protein
VFRVEATVFRLTCGGPDDILMLDYLLGRSIPLQTAPLSCVPDFVLAPRAFILLSQLCPLEVR